MKFGIRKTIALMIFTIVTGLLMTGCTNYYSVNGGKNKLSKKDALDFIVEKKLVDPISDIEIHTDFAKVELIPSDDFYVEIDYSYWAKEPEYTLKDGLLYFDDSSALPYSYSINFKPDNFIKVYLPDSAALGDLIVENSSGDVTLGGFTANHMDLDLNYGDLIMDEAVAVDANISLGTGDSEITSSHFGICSFMDSFGDAEFTNINAGESSLPGGAPFDQIDINMAAGDLTISELNFLNVTMNNSKGDIICDRLTTDIFDVELSRGDLKVNKSDMKTVTISSSYGDVDLNLLGFSDDYNLDISDSKGTIKVLDKKYVDQYILDQNSEKSITVSLSRGNVNVNFAEE